MLKIISHYILAVALLLLIAWLGGGFGPIMMWIFGTIFLILVFLFTMTPIIMVLIATGFILWTLISISLKPRFRNASNHLQRRLISLALSDEDKENVIGDLSEEFREFKSKRRAYIWLCKQVLKSVLPLVYKNLRGRLAFYFGERIR